MLFPLSLFYITLLRAREYSTPIMNCGIPVRSDILSELKERVTETDWHMLFNAILNCANRRNLLIPKERVEVVTEEE